MPKTKEMKIGDFVAENGEETIGDKKPRKSPIPQSYERIEAGALKLEFEDKVKLAKILKESIKAELEQKEAAFKSASELVKE